ncbi:MAG: hypothetical protein JNL62_06105 [Bryobacterales bacterium]|nr:hypothetical protein [Bryobacterales bacterium]
MYSTRVVLANESQEAFDTLFRIYSNEFQPVGQAEQDLVQNLVIAKWKTTRMENMIASAMDTDMFIHHENFDKCFQPGDPSMRHHDAATAIHRGAPGLLEYYERSISRYLRTYDRSLRALDRLQTRRLGEPPRRNVDFCPDVPLQTTDPEENTQILGNEPEATPDPLPLLGKTYLEPEQFHRNCIVDVTQLAPYRDNSRQNQSNSMDLLAHLRT